MSRCFDGAWGKRTGIGSILALVLALGVGWWATHRAADVDPADFASSTKVRVDDRRVMTAAELRARGAERCDQGFWGACEHDLAAAAMDPAGETAELSAMRARAIERLTRDDATATEVEGNAKTPR